ncbi:MAG: hypothetical protein Q4C20_11390 [Erysipelotrichaceae bacterium]|nr:hypothetical protein [Erysipelotrichaceae bacterium]
MIALRDNLQKCRKTNITTAVNLAIEEIPDAFTIRDLIPENRSEVVKMSIFEYDEQAHMALIKEESFAEGIVQGKKEERIQGILKAFEILKISGITETKAIEMISEQCQTNAEEINRIIHDSSQ